jgi:hypothetical protein
MANNSHSNTAMERDDLLVFADGVAAAEADRSQCTNPYVMHGRKWAIWNAGWEAGERNSLAH